MNATEFVYWLRGYLELSKPTTIDADTLKIINDRLYSVLKPATVATKIKDALKRHGSFKLSEQLFLSKNSKDLP